VRGQACGGWGRFARDDIRHGHGSEVGMRLPGNPDGEDAGMRLDDRLDLLGEALHAGGIDHGVCPAHHVNKPVGILAAPERMQA